MKNLISALQTTTERDRIFTLCADLICIAGFDGYFKVVNPSFTKVLGYSQEQLLSRPYVEFVHPDDKVRTNRETTDLSSGAHETTEAFSNRYRHADGSYRWLEWKSTAVASEQLIYAVARDVSDQRLKDQKLKDYARELERSNTELQTFAYVASHDLQEPLRAVAGCVQMLGERNHGKLDERSGELMTHAIDGAKRMQALIADLLEFSRAGSKGINRQWIDPAVAVAKAIRQLGVAIAESGAVIETDPLPLCWADTKQLTQLFQNLIGNSIKFRGDQPVKIRIHCRREGEQEVFTVSDNGIGIDPEYHERIFGVFQRLNNRSQYPGTGIGLAICKKIIDRHQGRIWIESAVGQGATFCFTFSQEIAV